MIYSATKSYPSNHHNKTHLLNKPNSYLYSRPHLQHNQASRHLRHQNSGKLIPLVAEVEVGGVPELALMALQEVQVVYTSLGLHQSRTRNLLPRLSLRNTRNRNQRLIPHRLPYLYPVSPNKLKHQQTPHPRVYQQKNHPRRYRKRKAPLPVPHNPRPKHLQSEETELQQEVFPSRSSQNKNYRLRSPLQKRRQKLTPRSSLEERPMPRNLKSVRGSRHANDAKKTLRSGNSRVNVDKIRPGSCRLREDESGMLRRMRRTLDNRGMADRYAEDQRRINKI